MRIFGVKITFKRQARWVPYESYIELSDAVIKLSNQVEAIRQKVYRDGKKEKADLTDTEEIIPPVVNPSNLSGIRTGDTVPG